MKRLCTRTGVDALTVTALAARVAVFQSSGACVPEYEASVAATTAQTVATRTDSMSMPRIAHPTSNANAGTAETKYFGSKIVVDVNFDTRYVITGAMSAHAIKSTNPGSRNSCALR